MFHVYHFHSGKLKINGGKWIVFKILFRCQFLASLAYNINTIRYCDDCNKPVVKAQLYQDTSTSFYTHMDLTCPDNSTIYNITLTENHKNKEVIKGQLSNICREECDVLFSN